jgi:glucan phosphoethanolaminetransferase (alkaline phosphatase superfamily)
MIGSHWYYNNRIEDAFKRFKPITTSKYLGSLEETAIVNSYDNTIVYLDYFLSSLIDKLKQSSKKTLLIYISDHGETLGEDNKWLHAQEHKASKNPAMLVWFSDNFYKNYSSEIKHLKLKQHKAITTDFLFHSILDIAKVKNYKFLKNKSIFH